MTNSKYITAQLFGTLSEIDQDKDNSVCEPVEPHTY